MSTTIKPFYFCLKLIWKGKVHAFFENVSGTFRTSDIAKIANLRALCEFDVLRRSVLVSKPEVTKSKFDARRD